MHSSEKNYVRYKGKSTYIQEQIANGMLILPTESVSLHGERVGGFIAIKESI